MDGVPEIVISDTRNQPKIGFKASRTRIFFIFGKFLALLKIVQSFSVHSAHSIHFEKTSNMPKKIGKE